MRQGRTRVDGLASGRGCIAPRSRTEGGFAGGEILNTAVSYNLTDERPAVSWSRPPRKSSWPNGARRSSPSWGTRNRDDHFHRVTLFDAKRRVEIRDLSCVCILRTAHSHSPLTLLVSMQTLHSAPGRLIGVFEGVEHDHF